MIPKRRHAMTVKMDFVDPTAGSVSKAVALAARPPDLSGKVVGVLDNTKEQADVILETLGESLREKYGVKEVVVRRKEHYSKPAPDEMIAEMADQCDVVICALGG
jgi:DNA-binding transcriptional regulator LsrR (DeoR family)|tara:strand:+ start:80 stop:394 length:315 start_codon:yes stop_codon:yes gene_type:complete